jgi:hypothetical protein
MFQLQLLLIKLHKLQRISFYSVQKSPKSPEKIPQKYESPRLNIIPGLLKVRKSRTLFSSDMTLGSQC